MRYLDMHCDTVTHLLREEDEGRPSELRENNAHIDLLRMKKAGYLLQNFAVFTPLGYVDNPMAFALRAIDKYYEEMEKNSDLVRPVYTYADIEKNDKECFMSGMLTLEEGAVVNNDLRILRDFYRLGVRMITLTWNFENGIAFPNFTPKEGLDEYTMLRMTNEKDGLTEFGKDYVRECNRLGIIVDVSHLGDKGFWDVIELSTKPIVASHSNARSVCSVARNLKDDMILALHKNGGVMGMNFCDEFIADDNNGSVENIIRHIDHIRDLGCIDNIGLGSDFDGISTRKEMEECGKITMLSDALAEHGYSTEEIEKICYKNSLRVYKEVIG